jgi:thioredoxin 2
VGGREKKVGNWREVMEQPGYEMIQCSKCRAKNRIPSEKMNFRAKCGRCGTVLQEPSATDQRASSYTLRCLECRAKNRIPSSKIQEGVVCGKCKKPLKIEELFEPQPLMITDGNFGEKVLNSPLPVLLFAWAPWCSSCRAFMPVIDDFAKDSESRIRVGKLNVDQNPNLSSKYNILSVPQIFVFDNGDLRENFPGAIQKHEIMLKMGPYL